MAEELLAVLHKRDVPIRGKNVDAVAKKCIVSHNDYVRDSLAQLWELHLQNNCDTITRRLQEVIVFMGFDPWPRFESDLDTVSLAVQQKDTTFAIDVTSYVVYGAVVVTALVITMLHVKRIRHLQTHEMSITGYTLLAVSTCFAFLQIFFHTMPDKLCADEVQVLQGLSLLRHVKTESQYDGFVKSARLIYEADVQVNEEHITARMQFDVSAQCSIKRFFAHTPRSVLEVHDALDQITRNIEVVTRVSMPSWSDQKNAKLSTFFQRQLYHTVYSALIDLIFPKRINKPREKLEMIQPE